MDIRRIFLIKGAFLVLVTSFLVVACKPVTSPNYQFVCFDFEELSSGDSYTLGDNFTASGVDVTVTGFVWPDGTTASGGFVEVQTGGLAGGSGNELAINNISLTFDFIPPANGLALRFGEYGGNLNIELNGDFVTFDDFTDIDGSTIGGVDIAITLGSTPDQGVITFTGELLDLSIGGQELWIDNTCGGSTGKCIDFSDLVLASSYSSGDVFSSAGISVEVSDFMTGALATSGSAQIGNTAMAGGSGNEIGVNNVNLSFDFGGLIEGLELNFGYYGGNLNIAINGEDREYISITDLDGEIIGGVEVTIAIASAPGRLGVMTLTGDIDSFKFGGQELWIDNVCPFYPE